MSIAIVILAAGAGRRFGAVKQLASFAGRPLLETVIAVAQAQAMPVWLALGAHREDICERVQGVQDCLVLDVERWQDGQSASLHRAVREAEALHLRGMVVMLGDQPLVTKTDVADIVERALAQPARAVATRQADGGPGVPAYLPRECFAALLELEGDVGARAVLRRLNPAMSDIAQRIQDVDTPRDLERLEQTARGKGESR